MLDVYHAYLDNYAVAVTTYERLTRYQPFKKFIDVRKQDEKKKNKSEEQLQMIIKCIR